MSPSPLNKTVSAVEYRDDGLLEALDDDVFAARQRRRTSDEEYAERMEALKDEDLILSRLSGL